MFSTAEQRSLGMKRAFAPFRPSRLVPLLAGALALSACGGIVPATKAPSTYGSSNDEVQVGTGRDYPRADRSHRQSLGVGSAQTGLAVSQNDRTCHAELSAAGARFSPVPDTYAAPGCNMVGTVKLASLAGDSAQFGLSNLGAVKCQTAKAFSAWARFGVDRAARQILGSPLARIETMGSYACRNILGSNRRSAHATGNAIDVSGFVLADGRRITLKGDWNKGTQAEREFLRVIHRNACKRFGTVLGPEYDRAHEDHFHLEGTGAQFCR